GSPASKPSAPSRRSAAPRSWPVGPPSPWRRSFPGAAFPERGEADPLAELLERDTDGRRRARQQAAGRESRQRVHLETPEAAVRIHAEIGAAVALELQRAVRSEAERLHAARLLRRQIRREDLVGAARLVLRRVVEDRREPRNDLADRKRLVVEDTDRELAARDVALDHHGIVVTCGIAAGR